MSYEEFNTDNLTEARTEAIRDSIHPITLPELKALGESLFPSAEHPWREKFFSFLNENADKTFHHAVTHDRVHVIYCPAQEKGMWFLPGSGMGPLQTKGLKILKEIVGGA